jgi:hypothetical protein
MSVPTTAVFLNKTTPAAPANRQNIAFASDNAIPQQSITASDPDFVGDTGSGGLGGNVPPPPPGSAAAGFVLRADGTFGLPPALGGSMNYKGNWSGAALYAQGDVTLYGGEAWLCVSPVDESIVPGFVQAAAAGGASVTFVASVTAGNLLIVFVAANGAAVTPTDTLGTTYTLVDQSGGVGFFGNLGSMYWGVAPASGANTVSTGIGGASGVAIAEFRGTTAIVDTHAANINVASLSLTTAHPTMIIIGRAEHPGNTDTYTGTGGVTIGVQRSDAFGGTIALGYVAEGSAGTYTPGLSGTSDHSQVMIAGAFLDGSVSPDQDTEHWLSLGTIQPSGPANQVVATPDGAAGQAVVRTLVSADLPVATTTQLGAVEPDGTSIGVAAGVISAARLVATKTANYTATSSDNAKLLAFNLASAITLTLPVSIPANGWFIHVQNIGAGTLTVAPGSFTLDGASSSLSVTTGQGLMIASNGSNYVTERGMSSGGSGTVTSVGLTVPNGMSVAGSPVTTSGTLAISAVYQMGSFLVGTPAAAQIVGAWAFLYAWTLPGNAVGSVGKCGTNPTALATYSIKKNGSAVGTVTISTSGTFTFATTGGTSVSFTAGDTLTLVAPTSPDATLSDVQVIFLANR